MSLCVCVLAELLIDVRERGDDLGSERKCWILEVANKVMGGKRARAHLASCFHGRETGTGVAPEAMLQALAGATVFQAGQRCRWKRPEARVGAEGKVLLHLDVHGTILVVVMFMSRCVWRVAEHDESRSGFVQLLPLRHLCAACGARGAARVAEAERARRRSIRQRRRR